MNECDWLKDWSQNWNKNMGKGTKSDGKDF